MTPTLSYDDGRTGSFRPSVDASSAVATVAYDTHSGKRGILWTPCDGRSEFDDILFRLGRLLAESEKDWWEYWYLFAEHPWSRKEWKNAARHAAHKHPLGSDGPDEVRQAGHVALCESLAVKVDFLAWLEAPQKRFEKWFRKFVSNLCNAAARKMAKPIGLGSRQSPDSPLDEFLQKLADYRSNESPGHWNRMLAVLRLYPMRTRAVVLLQAHGHTWDEVAATLCVTVEAARWAVEAYRNELCRDFAPFR